MVGKHCRINLIYSSFCKGFKDARPSEGNVSATQEGQHCSKSNCDMRQIDPTSNSIPKQL